MRFYSCEDLPTLEAIQAASPSRLDAVEEGKPPLSGAWEGIPYSIEGMDEFLDVGGVGWAKKQLAKSLVNKFTPRQEITNNGNSFTIVVKQPRGVDTKEFVVDGPAFKGTFGPEKAPGTGLAYWDGDVLVMKVEMPDKTTESRRWIEDDTLHQTDKLTMAKTGRSAVLKRAFKRSGLY